MTKKTFTYILLVLFYGTSTLLGAKLDSRLQFMLWQSAQNASALSKSVQPDLVRVSLLFDNVPSASYWGKTPGLNIRFKMLNGSPAHVGKIYTAFLPLSDLPELARDENIISIEYAGPDIKQPCLNVSANEVQASLCWPVRDKRLQLMTGRGITVGVVDNPPDIFHPMFWRADGDTLAWTDVNDNQQYDDGIDGVDMDQDGTIGPDELLEHINTPVIDFWDLFPEEQSSYEPAYDWLYLDLNRNGQRDYGPGAGFTESDPGYGEPLFICLDSNQNDQLDPGELLVVLKTCKVKSISIYAGLDENNEPSYHIYQRGTNLIDLEETDSHGTAVGGIVAGGIPGVTALTGMAPDADLIYGDEDYLATADIDIILFEQGWYSQQYMDGSSHDEIRIDTMASNGIIPVVPSGNMNLADVHMAADVPANDSIQVTIHWPDVENSNGNPFFISFLWDDPDSNFSFTLNTPEGVDYPLSNNEHITLSFNYQIWGNLNISDRGTRRYDIVLFKTSRISETWQVTIHNLQNTTKHIDGYVYDPRFGWDHQARFLSFANKAVTMTVPSTADSAICVGSYNTRTTNEDSGALSGFSGRGPRIDGLKGVDITAPGKVIFTSDVNSRYTQFSGGYWGVEGTSFSGPHAAGAVALMLQLDPTLSVASARKLLEEGAASDANTGATPNPAWGGGKLRILNTLKKMPQYPGANPGGSETPEQLSLLQNYPNPFNGGTTIEYELDTETHVSVKVYNIRGQLVSTIYDAQQLAGIHTLTWNTEGKPSGIYFIKLSTSSTTIIKKCTLLR